MVEKKSGAVLRELKKHLPFSLVASLFAGVLVSIFYMIGQVPSESLFEFLHPAHVLVSAIATSAIYWKYKRPASGRRKVESGKWVNKLAWINAILVGVGGAIIVGSLSDVVLPWLAGNLFSLHTHFHLPILEEPILILGVAGIGAVLGMYFDLFKVSHLLHVFLSVFASLFYLLAFSVDLSFTGVILVSGLVFLAVYIPCCISDIVFPLFFIKDPCLECGHFH